MREQFNVNVKLNKEILKIDSQNKIVFSNKGEYTYDKLIFTTIAPPIKGIESSNNWSTCRTMKDFDKISQEALNKDTNHIKVIRAGLIGI